MTKDQFVREVAKHELRPTIIDRVSDDEIYFGFPLHSCKGEDDPKWLIQYYLKVGNIEMTGFPNGKREFTQRWSDRYTLKYKQGENFEEVIN